MVLGLALAPASVISGPLLCRVSGLGQTCLSRHLNKSKRGPGSGSHPSFRHLWATPLQGFGLRADMSIQTLQQIQTWSWVWLSPQFPSSLGHSSAGFRAYSRHVYPDTSTNPNVVLGLALAPASVISGPLLCRVSGLGQTCLSDT